MFEHRKNIALCSLTAVLCSVVFLSACGRAPASEAEPREPIREKQQVRVQSEELRVSPQEITASTKGVVKESEKGNKFQFLFFYEKGSDESDRMAKVINQAKDRWSDKAGFRSIDINDSKQRGVLSQYGIWRAPVTLVTALDGTIVVAGFPGVVGLGELEEALVSPKTIEIVGGLQQRKTIFLSVQDADTQYAEENTKAVNDVAEVLGKSVKIVEVDPKDEQEASLLKRLKVKPDTTNSVIMVIARGGVIVDRFERKVTNKELFASFKKVLAQSSGCGSGSGGCGGR